MQKIQVLFPDPQMKRLREMANKQDRPISEIIRRATEAWMDRMSPDHDPGYKIDIPVFHAGEIQISAEEMRDKANSRN